MLIRRLIEVSLLEDGVFIRERRAVCEYSLAALRVAGQIVIGPVRNTFDFVELPCLLSLRKEPVKKIRGGLGVMGKLFLRLRVLLEIRRLDAVLVIPGDAICNP